MVLNTTIITSCLVISQSQERESSNYLLLFVLVSHGPTVNIR